uniref:Uncharacterized protein n=1 Tax=Caenorhabditis japonica TaxID=281687 RepID=A0A8R1J143_CAEJA
MQRNYLLYDSWNNQVYLGTKYLPSNRTNNRNIYNFLFSRCQRRLQLVKYHLSIYLILYLAYNSYKFFFLEYLHIYLKCNKFWEIFVLGTLQNLEFGIDTKYVHSNLAEKLHLYIYISKLKV